MRHGPTRDGLDDALEVLDQTIVSLVAVGGLEMAHMTRDDGWRFLSLGRHLERLRSSPRPRWCRVGSGVPGDPALLEWLLDLSDSLITYRARYSTVPNGPAVPTCCCSTDTIRVRAVPAGQARQARALLPGGDHRAARRR